MSGPSGAGKSSVIRSLLRRRPDLSFSVSSTTRQPRPGEGDGRDYRFVSVETFKRLIEDGAFLEWAEVFGHRYGTLLAPIADALEQGRHVLLEVDVQGAATVRDRIPDAILIFLQPPSEEDLVRRLRTRHTEGETELARRMASARHEMEQAGWFHYVVVNDDVERAAAEVAAIIDEVTKENPIS